MITVADYQITKTYFTFTTVHYFWCLHHISSPICMTFFYLLG